MVRHDPDGHTAAVGKHRDRPPPVTRVADGDEPLAHECVPLVPYRVASLSTLLASLATGVRKVKSVNGTI